MGVPSNAGGARRCAPAFLALLSLAAGQGLTRFQMAGRAVASQFDWRIEAQVTAPAGGSGTIQVEPGWLTLADGRAFEPWGAGVPIVVEDGAATETVVVATSTCVIAGAAPCTLTATFAHAHDGRLFVHSATDGLQEAINYLGGRGGSVLLTPDWSAPAAVIASATGSPQVQILDQRGGAQTWYHWNGTNYTAAAAIATATTGVAAATIGGVRYADQWCATPGVLDQTCLTNATAGFAGELYIPSGQYTIGASLTLPAGIRYGFAAGASLVLPPGIVVTVNGEIEAGNEQIFSVVAVAIKNNAAMAAGAATLTSASANFSAADVGTKLYVGGASAATQFGLHLPLVGVITGVSSPTTATASFANAGGAPLVNATAIFGGSYVAFGTQRTAHLNPIWWGADPTNSRDSTNAFNEAFTAGGDANIPVVIATGNYQVGNLEGGDPMAWGNYSAFAQIGGGAVILGGGRNFDQVTLHALPGTQGFILTRHNFAGGEWSGFSIDGGGTAGCFDAQWILPAGAPGPSTQNIFRDLAASGCAGIAFELDNQNDATIAALHGGAADLTTSATTSAAAGTKSAITPASMFGIYPGETVIVDRGANAEAIAVASVTGTSFTPFTNWQHAHGPTSYPVTIPAVGLSLLASTGEQSVDHIMLNNGLLLINVQNGAINGGFFAQGIEIGGAGTNVVAALGAQIWANPDLGAAIDANGNGTPQVDSFTCTGCQINAGAGQTIIQGSFFAGATFFDSLILNGTGSNVFGPITGNTNNPPVFHFIGSILTQPPNSGARWTATDSWLGPAGTNFYLSPFIESSNGIAVSASAAASTPLEVDGAAAQTAPVQIWQVPNVFLDAIDGRGSLNVQGEIRAEKNGAASAGPSALAFTWNASGGAGEGNFWDEFPAPQNSNSAFDWRIFDSGGTPHVLATLTRTGAFSASALAAPQLALAGGTPLTGQTGNGSNIVTDAGGTVSNLTLTGSLTLPATYQVNGNTIAQPAASGTLALTTQLPLAAASAALGGAALSAGQCASSTVTVAGASPGMAVVATPQAYPGAAFYWRGYVNAPNSVTVEVCAAAAGTPAASVYNVRVLP